MNNNKDFRLYLKHIALYIETLCGVLQVFLTVCTLVTLYFAKEVPITSNKPHLSDSAPLLDDPQHNGFDLSKSKPDTPIVDHVMGNRIENGYDMDKIPRDHNRIVGENHNEGFIDGPGAVMVNLLTSLRHLPPAMHSVLIVMALSWVCSPVLMLCQFSFKFIQPCQIVIIYRGPFLLVIVESIFY